MNDGDLTTTVTPVTTPIDAADRRGRRPARRGVQRDAAATRRHAVAGYNDMRVKLATMINEISHSSESLSAASTQMASTSEEAGRAIARDRARRRLGRLGRRAAGALRSTTPSASPTSSPQASRLSAETADETAAAAEEAR